MPCITLKSGLRLNLKEGALNDEKFRRFLANLDLSEQTRSAYLSPDHRKPRTHQQSDQRYRDHAINPDST